MYCAYVCPGVGFDMTLIVGIPLPIQHPPVINLLVLDGSLTMHAAMKKQALYARLSI